MYCEKTTIIDKAGLHARPASIFVQTANTFDSDIILKANEMEYDAKSMVAIMTACVQCGNEVEITANGVDEIHAVKQLCEMIRQGLEV